MNRNLLIGVFTLAAVGLVGGGLVVDAYRGDPNVKGPNYSPERHEAMLKAFENKDYDAWKSLMEGRGGRMMDVINKDNFAKFVEMRQLRLEGKVEEANKIRQELGLGQGNGDCGCGGGSGYNRGNRI